VPYEVAGMGFRHSSAVEAVGADDLGTRTNPRHPPLLALAEDYDDVLRSLRSATPEASSGRLEHEDGRALSLFAGVTAVIGGMDERSQEIAATAAVVARAPDRRPELDALQARQESEQVLVDQAMSLLHAVIAERQAEFAAVLAEDHAQIARARLADGPAPHPDSAAALLSYLLSNPKPHANAL
jgi:hypothetical protein